MNKVKTRLALLLAAIMIAGSLREPVFAVSRESAGAARGASAETGLEDPAQVTETEPLDLVPDGGEPEEPGPSQEEEYYTVRVEMDGGYGGIYHGAIYDDALGENVTDAASFTKKVKKGEAVTFMPGSLYIDGDQQHDFYGWSLEPGGEIVGEKTSYTPTGDCTLYANWTSHAAFLLMDDDHFPDGSKGKTVYADRDGWVTVPEEEPVSGDSGWRFYRWIWSDSGEPVEIVDGRFFIEYTRTVNPDWRPVFVESVTLDRESLDLEIGETAQLQVASILPDNALTRDISWRSSDEATATVDENGLVKGLRRGTAVITAAVTDGGGARAECTVKVDGGQTLVTYDPNGGYFSGSFYDAGTETRVEDPLTFSREDVGFGASFSSDEVILHSDPSMRMRGWSLTKDGDPVVKKTETYKTDRNVTLYAVWEPVYVVHVDMGGGNYLALVHDDATGEDLTSPGAFTREVKKGEVVTFEESRIYHSAEPERAFIGWSLEPGGEIVGEKTGYTPAADCTLYANWTKFATFEARGGSFAEGMTSVRNVADENGMVSVPAQTPVCDDESREFGGWTLTEGGDPVSMDENGRVQITQDCTFIPVWTDKKTDDPEGPQTDTWTVRIDFDGGYMPAARFDDETGEYISLPSSYTKKVKKGEELGEYIYDARHTEAHTALAGWSVEAEDGTQVTSLTKYQPRGYVPTGNCTIRAVWGEAYRVTLDLDGGTYSCSIWDDASRSYLENPGKVTVKALRGEHADLYASYAQPADPELKLQGWSLEKGGESVTPDKSFYTPDSDCTLYPIWAQAHTVTIDLQGAHYSGSQWDSLVNGSVMDPKILYKTVADGESIWLGPNEIVQEDSTLMLVGWSLSAGGEIILDKNTYTYKPEDDCTLYAVWDKFYTVTVDYNGGWHGGSVYDDALQKTVTDPGSYVRKVRRGQSFELNPQFSWFLGEKQHDFAGWSLSKGGAILEDSDSFTPTEDCTIYANWTSHAVFYTTVEGKFPDGSITIRADQDEDGNVTVPTQIPVYKDDTKVFDCWYLPATGEKIVIDENGMTSISYNVTFNPIWKDKPQEDPEENTWTVTLDANGGAFKGGQTQVTQKVSKGDIIRNTPEPATAEDKIFAGWTLPDGTFREDIYHYIPAENMTFKAVWSDYYTVKFDPAGGTGIPGYLSVNGGGEKVVTGRRVYFGYLTPRDPDGRRLFTGWHVEGAEEALEDQKYYTPDKDVTLVASWADPCKLIFDAASDGIDGYFLVDWPEYEVTPSLDPLSGDPEYNFIGTTKKKCSQVDFRFPQGVSLYDAVLGNYYEEYYRGNEAIPPCFEAFQETESGRRFVEFLIPHTEDDNVIFDGWRMPDGKIVSNYGLADFVPEVDGPVTISAVWKRSVTGIRLDKESLVLYKGKNSTLTATVEPADATDPSVSWKSSDTKVATVDQKGQVKAVAKGTATITATANDGSNVTASCTVTVRQPVTSVSLNKTNLALYKGRTFTLKATLAPSDAYNKKVTWKSSNTAIATVTSAGVVKGVKKGTATITATAADGSGKKASCTVTVRQPVTSVKLNKTTLTLNRGRSFTLKATLAPSDAYNKKVNWKSSNTAVATVTSAGVVKGIKKGTATITATAADGSKKYASCKVTVRQPVTSVKLNKTALTLNKGRTFTLKATVSPSNANNKNVKWTTSNKAVATVTAKGVVKGIKKGTVTITATAADGSGKKATCRITVK